MFALKVMGVEHNMPKIWYYGVFSLFHRCRASARLPSQKQKSIRTLCIFGAEQFKTRRFLFEQGTKSPPYCRMVRFLTQFRRKYAVLNHIGFDSPHLMVTVIIRTRQKCSIKAIFVAFAVALRQQGCHLKTTNLIFTPSIFDALQFIVCRFGLNQGTKHS